MRKFFLAVMLVFSVFNTAFAFHTPDREELNKAQQFFNGSYFAQDVDLIERYGLINVRLNDDNSAEIYIEGEKHKISPSNVQVGYDTGFAVDVFGKCVEPDCDLLYVGFTINTKAQIVVPKATSILLLVSKVTKDRKTEDYSIWVTKI